MRLWLAREHVKSSLWGSVHSVEVCTACCKRPVVCVCVRGIVNLCVGREVTEMKKEKQ